MISNKHLLDQEYIINKSFFETIKEMIVCVICTGIVVDPLQCNICENTFCKECISVWLSKSLTCPFKCRDFMTKEPSRAVKNLLDKISFTCPYECTSKEFTYESIIKHVENCSLKQVNCGCCGTLVYFNEIQELPELKKLKERVSFLEYQNKLLMNQKNDLELNLKKIKEKKNSFSGIQGGIPLPTENKKNETDSGLIDKCEHFKGNYKPIFTCCSKAYPCYLCHNEIETHMYEFSNKVICLICNGIYSGNQCAECMTIQIYKKKA